MQDYLTAAQQAKALEAAIDLVEQRGLWFLTLTEVAYNAGLNPGMIQRHYCSLPALLFEYYQKSLEETYRTVHGIEEFQEFTLAEKLQSFIETQLSLFGANRSFVQTSMPVAFGWPMNFPAISRYRGLFLQCVLDLVGTPPLQDSMPKPLYECGVSNMLGNYFSFMVLFWLQDKSENQSMTSQLMDQSIGVIADLLESPLPPRIKELNKLLFQLSVSDPLSQLLQQTQPKKGEGGRMAG